MQIMGAVERLFHRIVDNLYARWPQPRPAAEQLRSAKIISHRGDPLDGCAYENTLAAFDRAVESGVWGIEFDIRWTRDLLPVVCHDANLQRVFGIPLQIGNSTLVELRDACPLVPTLEEVIERYGKRVHLMAEIKEEAYPEPARQNRILDGVFQGLMPRSDFHLLSLSSRMFDLMRFVPRTACLPVAQVNLSRLSRRAVQDRMAGVAGHYLFVTSQTIRRHHMLGQKVATGYIGSQNCLFREINRGVDWIFSNQGAGIQAVLEDCLKQA
jgi:glycerophosphoryl diester phosphodiesterase